MDGHSISKLDLSLLLDDGISIPKAYTSYIAPLSSEKLWNEARGCKENGKPPEVSSFNENTNLNSNLRCRTLVNFHIRF